MAKTLTTESNLRRRRQAIERELNFLRRMRLLEWGAALVCLAIGFLWQPAFGIGGVLLFLALGHEARRREQTHDQAETAGLGEAKETVARLLDEQLANDHYVLNDLHLVAGREKCWIDHLVVAPSGLFVIQTLNWEGKIAGDTAKHAYQWKIRSPGGKLRTARNPVGLVLRERRILENWLKGTALLWERIFPVIVMAHPGAELQIANAERRVLTPRQAVDFINGFCFENPVLSNAEVEKLANGLHAHSAGG